ncbi:cilia- and flagella-associated protein 99 isoform X3 [Carettochelys insculpta]|uniref:cilia- and flagella-associated protein 99 isoform X3 n=1 Tax=Carettochelys insculpta TaxID=44489 RepID=UPI003EC05528
MCARAESRHLHCKLGLRLVEMAISGKHIEIVVQQLNKFNPEKESVEHLLDESTKVLQTFKVSHETFVLETLAGCIEYQPLLDIVVNAFFVRDGKHCLFSERNLYVVICYLATFQLEDLGLQQFSRIVKSLDIAKMHKFLRFFFSVLNLSTWIKDEWSHIYDSLYVKENWIDPLLGWQPKIEPLIEQLADILANRVTTVKTSTVTKPKEFDLTIPKPRAIPVPEPIPLQEKHQPVPQSTYKLPKEKQHLLKLKYRNRQKAEELLLEANINQFRCAAVMPEKKALRGYISDSMKNKTKFQAQKIHGKIDNVPIKLNAAAILREGALYQRKMEQELNRIESLLRGARDPSEFLEWQKQMREKDLEQQLAEIECRRLQGKLSHEEAVLARQNVIQENKKKAELKREETAELMRQYAEKRLQEEKEMRELVEQVVEGHKNVKQARMKLQKYKRQIGRARHQCHAPPQAREAGGPGCHHHRLCHPGLPQLLRGSGWDSHPHPRPSAQWRALHKPEGLPLSGPSRPWWTAGAVSRTFMWAGLAAPTTPGFSGTRACAAGWRQGPTSPSGRALWGTPPCPCASSQMRHTPSGPGSCTRTRAISLPARSASTSA